MRNPPSSSTSTRAAGTSSSLSTKTTPCCSKVGLKRGPWTAEEDEVLSKYIEKEGEGRWRTLPKRAGLLRCGKSCRLRWMNYLRPSVKRGHIAPDEEDLILRLHRLLGNRWSLIAGRIPGRTDNEIKNYWNTHLSKKLISQGIDPRTHKPLHHTNTNTNTNNPNPAIPQSHNTSLITPSTCPPPHNNSSTSPPNPIMDHYALTPFNPNFHSSTTTHAHHLDPYQPPPPFSYSPLAAPNSHASAMPYSSDNDNNNVLLLNVDEHGEDDLNYCSDDVFSSFLSSLINDDAFSAQHPPNLNGANIHIDPPPTPPSLPWEPSPISSSTFSHNIDPSPDMPAS